MDAANLSVLLLGIALIFQLLASSKLKGGLTQRFGKVKVEGIELPELLLSLGLVAFFWWQVQSAGALASTGEALSEATLTTGRLVEISIVHLFFLLSVVVFLTKVRKKDLVEFFGLNRLPWKKVLIWVGAAGVGSTLAVIGITQILNETLLIRLLGEPRGQETLVALQNSTDPVFILMLVISACVIAPIWEEAVFRGFLYPVIKRFSQPLLAVLVVSMLFAAVHNGAFILVPLICLAGLLCLTYELTGSLWVPIGIHAVFNGLNIVLALISGDGPAGT